MSTDDEQPFVFDEDFVRGASRKEASAEERLATTQRVARDHANARPFRSVDGPSLGKPGKASKARKPRSESRRKWLVGLVTVGIVGGLFALQPGAFTRSSDAHTVSAPPIPADEKTHRILPAVKVAGTGGYNLLLKAVHDDQSIRFDPCRPIHFVVRHDHEPVGGSEMVTDAISTISKATGLQFVNDGSTDEKPTKDRPTVDKKRYGNRWSPILIAWATVAEAPELKGDVDGYAGPLLEVDHGLHLVSAQVVLDEAQLTLRNGTADPAAYTTMMHELSHAVGLAHTNDPSSLMYPELTPAQHGLTVGDRRGLAFVGNGTCFT